MKVTTLRFGPDLWSLLQREAELAGVSVSQYVREAALARAAATAGARGELAFGGVVAGAREVASGTGFYKRHEIELALGALARAVGGYEHEASDALIRQSEQATRRASELAKGARATTRST